jgi:glutamate synthase domain-containing protein 2
MELEIGFTLITFALVLIMVAGPPVFFGVLYWMDRRQSQHAVLRNFPVLGRLRYLLEHVGPELRQYLFAGDWEGKPFSRDVYTGIVLAGKYLKTLIAFGSKRDFEAPGWYLRNALLPTLMEDMGVGPEPAFESQRYRVEEEGLFHRSEKLETVEVHRWTLAERYALRVGEGLPEPWVLSGLVGMSGMSYGALGRNAIRALSLGLGHAGASWMNTGEGGVSEHHLCGGGDVVLQIGPGLFGVRNEDGEWCWDRFRQQAEVAQIRAFELKFHQGAKIRGGHVEGVKVTEEIAAIRGVPVGQTIDSPNRFTAFRSLEDVFDHLARMRELGGKPVGLKIVVGGPGAVDPLAEAMARRGDGPDFITVDGSEGGSGATYQEMADSMGVPLRPGLIELDDALHRHGVRDRVRIFASGKLVTPDRVALALCAGADAVNIARGFMVSVGCIQAQKCHTNQCPVGVATTDEELMRALVVEEKQWRVANYVIALRAGLVSLAAAAGLPSPTQFRREHAVYQDSHGRIASASQLFDPAAPTPPRVAAVAE